MKRFLFLLIILFIVPKTYAYVSPESYAVNEADLTDYRMVAPSPKLNIDALQDDRFQAPNLVEADINIDTGEDNNAKKVKTPKNKKDKSERHGLVYKSAKWWVDQRYKREEPHHGQLHEIKVNKRIEYEKREQEAMLQKEQQKAQIIDYAEEQVQDFTTSNQENTKIYEINPALYL